MAHWKKYKQYSDHITDKGAHIRIRLNGKDDGNEHGVLDPVH